ncbi:MAG: S-adenosyl-l-methionine hydroxide adenosyltransferase family protein [Nitrososphaerota archaeon]
MFKKRPIIALLTDFGYEDPYISEMKAVILSIERSVEIIDVTHSIPSYDVYTGAFILSLVAPYFPKDTIFVAVVDPGVGSIRKSIIIETEKKIFIGPDNGLLVPAAEKNGIKNIYEISEKFLPKRETETFHGRDIFSVIAGYIAKGIKPSKLGIRMDKIVRIKEEKALIEKNKIIAKVLYIDKFGNIITNITKEDINSIHSTNNVYRIEFKEKSIEIPLKKFYSEVPEKSPLLVFGGTGFLEISINLGNASKTFGINIGDRIEIYPIV